MYNTNDHNQTRSSITDVRNTSSYVFVQFLQAFNFFFGGGDIYINSKFDQRGQIFHNVLGFLLCLLSVKVLMCKVLGGGGD